MATTVALLCAVASFLVIPLAIGNFFEVNSLRLPFSPVSGSQGISDPCHWYPVAYQCLTSTSNGISTLAAREHCCGMMFWICLQSKVIHSQRRAVTLACRRPKIK